MTDMNDWINERRRIHNAANLYGQDEVHPRGSVDDKTIDRIEANNAFSYDAHNTLPALLTAVENVLELHQPEETGVGDQYWKEPDYCPMCSEYYPCQTVRAIEGAINE